MTWQPWIKYREDQERIKEIKEPPCKDCQMFRPLRKYDKFGNFDGIAICMASEMNHDFSCFVQKRIQNNE